MKARFAGGKIQRDIIVQRVEIEEIFLDNFLFITKSDDEFIDVMAH